jgi:hypothetical protein
MKAVTNGGLLVGFRQKQKICHDVTVLNTSVCSEYGT